jgi:phosphoglycerol transferase MdoB-like AlkP superfamily enzyme
VNPGSSRIEYWLYLFKPAFKFLLKLLILLSLLKCIFFLYNVHSGQGWKINNFRTLLVVIGWSVFYDVAVISLLALPLSILFFLFRRKGLIVKIIYFIFGAIFAFMVLLNVTDIFYFPFKLQRADAELLYVLRNPFEQVNATYFLVAVSIIIAFFLLALLIYKWMTGFFKSFKSINYGAASVVFFLIICLAILLSGAKKFLPTYPLVSIRYNQLPLTQNSFHQFMYSLFRKNESTIFNGDYIQNMPDFERLTIIKKNVVENSSPKNIVLFIMESVPYDFFDSGSQYKVKMPFLDSLVTKSTFFTDAFSYSHNSNKGITAILAGTPTVTEIPLYHSAYTSMPMVHVGSALATDGYSSAFFIGDNYDNFGFAKCINWLGIQRYYCMTDIPGYRHMEKHTMGLHDEYVLHFMQDKIDRLPAPFFAINFNISTHFPNDLPAHFKEKYPLINRTPHMKTMSYYNECLAAFFKHAVQQPWYKNSVFIFCSDHWMNPDFNNFKNDVEKNFRIALFIFDPQKNIQAIVHTPVSQLDVVNTILNSGNYKKEFISYGDDLLQMPPDSNRVVFAKENNVLYEAFDSSYVLGFNVIQGKPEFCYNYLEDKKRTNNLIGNNSDRNVNRLLFKMESFLHTAYIQYEKKKAD